MAAGRSSTQEMLDPGPIYRALVHQQRYLPAVQLTRYSPIPCLGQLLMLSPQFAALLPTPFGNVEFIALKLVDALIEDTEKDFKYHNWCDLDSPGVIV